jgi:hypothetical protein
MEDWGVYLAIANSGIILLGFAETCVGGGNFTAYERSG